MKLALIVVGVIVLLFGGVFFTQSNRNDGVIQQGVANTVLDLSFQSLTKVPDDVFKKTHLEELDVSHNQLSGSLQAEIRHLSNLKILKLNDNKFTSVPAEVGQLSNLEVLDLSNNNLTGLPYELGNLSNLKIINVSGNNYSEQDLAIIRDQLPESVVIRQ